MNNSMILPIVAFVIACISAMWLHPKVVNIAQLKGITDKPNKRKLQREPVPVLGGLVVFFGILMGVGLTSAYYECSGMMLFFSLLLVMLYTGTMDDIVGLSPRARFLIEIVAVLILIFVGGYSINDFYGLWGFNVLPAWFSVLLTLVAAVGIINAINLIDGVDGLSSGYCIIASAIFGLFFWTTGDIMMTILAVSCIGALIPFFMHNVFGKRSKMFIGDGGTLVMGLVMALFVLKILDNDNASVNTAAFADNFGLIPFTLAVLAIPIFDTLRVIFTRLIRKTSPFKPDKKHLHHAFIEVGCSHLTTTACTLLLNVAIIVIWFLLYWFGASSDVQLYTVVCAGLVFTVGVYAVLRLKAKSVEKEEIQ